MPCGGAKTRASTASTVADFGPAEEEIDWKSSASGTAASSAVIASASAAASLKEPPL